MTSNWTGLWQDMLDESLRLQRDSADAWQEMLRSAATDSRESAIDSAVRNSARMWQNGFEWAATYSMATGKLAATLWDDQTKRTASDTTAPAGVPKPQWARLTSEQPDEQGS